MPGDHDLPQAFNTGPVVRVLCVGCGAWCGVARLGAPLERESSRVAHPNRTGSDVECGGVSARYQVRLRVLASCAWLCSLFLCIIFKFTTDTKNDRARIVQYTSNRGESQWTSHGWPPLHPWRTRRRAQRSPWRRTCACMRASRNRWATAGSRRTRRHGGQRHEAQRAARDSHILWCRRLMSLSGGAVGKAALRPAGRARRGERRVGA